MGNRRRGDGCSKLRGDPLRCDQKREREQQQKCMRRKPQKTHTFPSTMRRFGGHRGKKGKKREQKKIQNFQLEETCLFGKWATVL
jgi:hypothetical protein